MERVHCLLTLSLAACLALGWASTAAAHKPTFAPDGYDGPAGAFLVGDPDVSIVVYRDVTCEAPQLWMTFEARANYALFVQLLVPQIERLADYRPSVAVLGPGLPARNDLPFTIPGDMGAVVFDTDSIANPEVFDEPFTGTTDWMLVEETVALAEPGKHYVVAWNPAGSTGKLAVALGDIEDFGVADALAFPGWVEEARTFHETEDYPPAQTPVEVQCTTPGDTTMDAGIDDGTTADAGAEGASDAGADAGAAGDAGSASEESDASTEVAAADASTDAWEGGSPAPVLGEAGTAMPDASSTDAGVGVGGESPTTGGDPGGSASSAGGGCAAAGSSNVPTLAGFVTLAFLLVRRRRALASR